LNRCAVSFFPPGRDSVCMPMSPLLDVDPSPRDSPEARCGGLYRTPRGACNPFGVCADPAAATACPAPLDRRPAPSLYIMPRPGTRAGWAVDGSRMTAETAGPGARVLPGAFALPRPVALAGAFALALGLAACAGPGKEAMEQSPPAPGNRPRLVETVGEFAIAPIYADGFEDLSPSERALAFYLYRAALAGRDIYYDQMGRQGLEIRDLLEEILTHPQGIPRPFLDSMLVYLKLFWINSGNHNDRTRAKFVPQFSFDDLRSAAHMAARNGAAIRMAVGETLDSKLTRLRHTLFDPAVDPLVTCKAPPPGRDIITGSSVNYYDGVTLADVTRFAAKHPLNSRLVNVGGASSARSKYHLKARFDSCQCSVRNADPCRDAPPPWRTVSRAICRSGPSWYEPCVASAQVGSPGRGTLLSYS